MSPWKRYLLLITAAALTVTTTAVATAGVVAKADKTVKACAVKKTGALRLSKGSCKSSERAVSWSVTGPEGATGPQGPAGALDTTPVNVEYASTSSSSHDVNAVGGVVLRLECGTSRIGTLKADLVTQADQVHGTSVLTVYNGQTILSSTPYAINTQGQTDLDGASVSTVGSTHAVENFHAVVVVAGEVSEVDMFVTRDTRQGHPVCAFLGAVTHLGAATVTPS